MLLDLFDGIDQVQEHTGSTSDNVEEAVQSLMRVLADGYPVQLQFSGGKDSSSCANLLLTAARRLHDQQQSCAPIYVCTADTGVENPVVRTLADHELKKMRDYAMRNEIDLQVFVGRPTLSASYAPRVIGGRALPPFPVGKRDCTTDWKISVSQRVSRRVKERADKAGKPLVTVIGTRASESQARAINTAKRGETANELWFGPSGDARLSPILHWSTDDVWTYLGECAAGEHESYSDFADLIEFYSAAAGGECVVVADMRQGQGTPCGARSGCWVCGAVQNDTSVENMIKTNPQQYGYLEPLLRFRNFVVNSQWDWSLRNFLGRTIDDEGYMSVKADQFSPQMCERLLRYLLTAQDKANEMGSPVRVEAIGLRELFAIDFYWSVRAWHPPFHALSIYLDHIGGNRAEAPVLKNPVKPSPVPNIGRIYVGNDWDEDESTLRPQGLRDPLWEMHSESCGPRLRVGTQGNVFLELDEMPEFNVDEEGACMFLDFEAQDAIKNHQRSNDWTVAASIYLRYGVVTLGTGQSSGIDKMIRRSQWIQRHGLHGHQSLERLKDKCQLNAPLQADIFS